MLFCKTNNDDHEFNICIYCINLTNAAKLKHFKNRFGCKIHEKWKTSFFLQKWDILNAAVNKEWWKVSMVRGP